MRDFMLRSPDAGDLGPSGGGGGGEGRPFGGLKFRGPGTMVSPGQKKNVTLVRTKDSNGSFEQQPDGSYRYVHPSGNANADIASYFHLVSSGTETTFETPATSGSNPVDGSGEFLRWTVAHELHERQIGQFFSPAQGRREHVPIERKSTDTRGDQPDRRQPKPVGKPADAEQRPHR